MFYFSFFYTKARVIESSKYTVFKWFLRIARAFKFWIDRVCVIVKCASWCTNYITWCALQYPCLKNAWLTKNNGWFDEYIFWYSEPESTIIKLNLSSFFSPREACIVSVQYVTLQVHRHDHSLKMEFRFWKFQNMCSLKKKVTDPFCMIREPTVLVPKSCHEVWQPINQ